MCKYGQSSSPFLELDQGTRFAAMMKLGLSRWFFPTLEYQQGALSKILDLCTRGYLMYIYICIYQHMLMRRFGLAVWKSGNSWFSEPYIFELINIILKNNWLEVWEFMLYMNLYITFNLYLYYTHIIINNDESINWINQNYNYH